MEINHKSTKISPTGVQNQVEPPRTREKLSKDTKGKKA
jgi:hypothetical protein